MKPLTKKLTRFLFSSLLVSAAILVGDLTYGYITSSSNYYPPNYLTFQPPAAGGSYTDPIFGSVVKRMSNALTQIGTDGTGAVVSISPEFSTMSPFNLDNTRTLILFRSYFALYDGQGNYVRDLPLEVNASSEPRWSRRDPNT